MGIRLNQIVSAIYKKNHHTYSLQENCRFELSDNLDRNLIRAIEIAKRKAKCLFKEVFKHSDLIQLIVVSPQYYKNNKFRKFLFKNQFSVVDSFETSSWSEFYDGTTIMTVIETQIENFKLNQVIDGICYKDFYQPGKLKIYNPLVFFNPNEEILLNIYDDRGCDIWSENKSFMIELKRNYSSWIID